jgi:hypothetical protein
MKKGNVIFKLCIFLLSFALSSCESSYEKCKRYYIDEEGYSYDEACDQCDAEEDSYREATAR